jgi:hypothetical protein
MSDPRKKYDSTVARIAGNILSGLVNHRDVTAQCSLKAAVVTAVRLARAVVAEVERTEIPNENGVRPPSENKA